MLDLRKSVFLFFVLLYLPNGVIRSDSINENKIYKITSDSQSNSADGTLKATGNVIIEGENDFNAYADKLIYEKKLSKLRLKGNVTIRNYFSNEVFIKDASGDELTIFVDKGSFEFHNKKGERVKTSIRF